MWSSLNFSGTPLVVKQKITIFKNKTMKWGKSNEAIYG